MKKAIDCLDFCCIDNTIWMISGNCNALLKYEIESGKTSYVSFLSSKSKNLRYGYDRILTYDKKLIFVPLLSKSIVAFNTETGMFDYYNLFSTTKGGFSDGFIINDKLYCIPAETRNDLFIVDLSSMQITDRISIDVSSNKGLNRSYYYDGHIYLPIPGENMVLDVAIDSKNVDIIRIGEGTKLSAISGYDEIIFLQDSEKQQIIRYNIEKNNVSDVVGDDEKAHEIYAVDKNNVLVASMSCPIKMVSFETKTVTSLGKREIILDVGTTFSNGTFCVRDGVIYYFDRLSSSFLSYDNDVIVQHSIGLHEEDTMIMMNEMMDDVDKEVFSENELFSLSDFLSGI